jgi:hypothetical protein
MTTRTPSTYLYRAARYSLIAAELMSAQVTRTTVAACVRLVDCIAHSTLPGSKGRV